MFNWLQEYLTKPMIEKTPLQEGLECLALVIIGGIIWSIGHLTYKLELKWEQKKSQEKKR